MRPEVNVKVKVTQNGMHHSAIPRGITIVSKVAKIRNRYNQVPHLTQDTNGKVTNSHPKFGIPTSNNIGDMLWTQ